MSCFPVEKVIPPYLCGYLPFLVRKSIYDTLTGIP